VNSASNVLKGKPTRAPRMTQDEFLAWLQGRRLDIYRRAPYRAVPCDCGDVNCKGWRLVEAIPVVDDKDAAS
jgi:hypothetical protein